MLQNKESFTVEYLNTIKGDYATFVASFNESCKGPMSKEKGLDFLIDHIFVKLGALYETMIKSYESHIEDLNRQLLEGANQEKRQKQMIEDQNDYIKQYKSEKVAHTLQLDSIQNENEGLQKTREHDKTAYEDRINNLENKLENKTLINLEMQNKLSSLEHNLSDKKEVIKQKDLEIENLTRT